MRMRLRALTEIKEYLEGRDVSDDINDPSFIMKMFVEEIILLNEIFK